MPPSVVVAGSVAQKPGQGGHTWVFLQYLIGFKRLGWDVLFLDRLPETRSGCSAVGTCAGGQARQVRYLRRVMQGFGLEDAYALLGADGQTLAGMPRSAVLKRCRRSAFLLNVMGYLEDEELLDCFPTRVFLDIDPGFGQMWQDLGLHDAFAGHDRFVTIGRNIGLAGCPVPTCGLEWVTTAQPVVLDLWPAGAPSRGQTVTSVASWRGAYGPLEYGGERYGLRVHEFRKFVGLPAQVRRPFELALDIHPAEVADIGLLAANRWSVVDPAQVAGDPWAYREYLQGSWAEFMVAKGMYVQAQSGWFSDRSICYLASGRPVLAQDTGLQAIYPTGRGLITFRSLEEARAGLDALESDYEGHARDARALAETYFESDKILRQLLSSLEVA